MYQLFQVKKEAGTYSDTLEVYGLAHFIAQVILAGSGKGSRITIKDKGPCYEVSTNIPITTEMLGQLSDFEVIEFIKKSESQKVPPHIGQYYNYPTQRDLRREKRKEIEQAQKEYSGKEFTQKVRLINEKYQSEQVEQPLRLEHDVFAQFISNPYSAFLKLYGNFDNNRKHFQTLASEILNEYLPPKKEPIPTDYQEFLKKKKIKIDEKATMLQLLNPNQGKGLNKAKATGMSVGNLKGNWIKETMKVSGALNFGMICQAVKVGSTYDMKVFVPAFSDTKLGEKQKVLKAFKKTAKSSSPIKLDILNTLKIIEIFLKESTKEYRRGRKVKEFLLGLHSVYQKDLGQNKAVVNISFLETPDFIDLADKDDWLDIIDEQKKLMNGITEQGDAMMGLLAYRKFLNGSDINEYFKFHYWYAPYLMHELNKKQHYVTTNKIETLNKIFNHLNDDKMNFKEIIENEGFQSIAGAIRKSTVSLQYTPKDQRKFDVQYGIAQKLQNKSKSKDDLIAFVSEFVAKYNSDTARKNELYNAKKAKGENPPIQLLRTRVEEKHIAAFYELADNVKSNVLGAMLAAYGFALNKKTDKPDENE